LNRDENITGLMSAQHFVLMHDAHQGAKNFIK
jgi:hypothetical protein